MNEQQYWDWRALLATLMRGGAYGYYWRAEGKLSKWFDAQNPPATPTGPYNYYFGIHPVTAIPTHNSKGQLAKPENVRSQIAVIAAINCLFAEFDGKNFEGGKPGALSHIADLPLPPTVIIDSGGGYHCYFLLWDEIPIENATQRRYLQSVQWRWVDFVGSDAGAKDLARVLRIPGTFNRKPEYGPDFPEVTLVHVEWEAVYYLPDLTAMLPPVEKKKPARTQKRAGQSSDKAQWAQRLLSKLNSTRADDYTDWITVGMALADVPGGLRMWEAWSKGSKKFQDGECEAKWGTFGAEGVTLGTLYQMALDDNGGAL